ncbi:hypothetical protein [Rickettsiella endosymbiont of Dermanyssus gallinae]|uniref:hypothetical protein n=1 Tax=Rickettsiella endosymbiont of Dermanyssus gallinae TaxID=2856608 RepID=UPI001C52CE98|nr:hypothetical protein [Rickettsiella endosymbiont of Dermanyssus gallinae]
MLAAEEAVAMFQMRASAKFQACAESVAVKPQLPNEAIAEQSCCEEEEEAFLEPSYLSFKIAFVEARYDLKCAEQTLKCLRDTYLKEKNLELAANAKGKGDEAYRRFVWYREKQFYPMLRRYRDARKAYFKAFISRKINWLKNFFYTIKEIVERFIIKPIKNIRAKINAFNKPVSHAPAVHYDGVAAYIEKEKENGSEDQARLKHKEAFSSLHSPLKKMQDRLENKKETIEISANTIRYRCR